MSDLNSARLPNKIMSSSQLYQVINQLNDIISRQNNNKSSPETPKQIQNDNLVGIFFDKEPSHDEAVQLKDRLEKIIQTSPIIRLTLSDYPDEAFSEVITDWFRNLNPQCLIEVLVDPTIIGGVIIRTGRRIYDHSVRSQLSHSEESLTGILADV